MVTVLFPRLWIPTTFCLAAPATGVAGVAGLAEGWMGVAGLGLGTMLGFLWFLLIGLCTCFGFGSRCCKGGCENICSLPPSGI